jgi:hypothetical protein
LIRSCFDDDFFCCLDFYYLQIKIFKKKIFFNEILFLLLFFFLFSFPFDFFLLFLSFFALFNDVTGTTLIGLAEIWTLSLDNSSSSSISSSSWFTPFDTFSCSATASALIWSNSHNSWSISSSLSCSCSSLKKFFFYFKK